jgi:hypothetical protein
MTHGNRKVRERRTAGDVWRVQGREAADTSRLGPFDEIVVGRRYGEAWLHVEMLDTDSVYVYLAGRCFWLHLPAKGAPCITMEETRSWAPWKQCRKRPSGKRCTLGAGHTVECWAP